MADEISRRIAELQGWRVVDYANVADIHYWMLEHGEHRTFYKSEESAWEDAPDYANDLNQAWKLFNELPIDSRVIEADIEHKTYVAYGFGFVCQYEDMVDDTPEAAALAICKLWLKWKQEQDTDNEIESDEFFSWY